MKQYGLLQWMEAKNCITNSATSSIRSVNCDFSGGGVILGLIPATRLGDENKENPRICIFLLLDLHQGRSSTSPGSFFTAAFLSSSFKMVERRLPPPSSSATAFSGRRFKDSFNLLAVLPFWRPFSFDVVGSHLFVPSGFVPGDAEVDSIKLCSCHTGEGAGPNCVPHFLSRVFYANCKGLVSISIFFQALSVSCTSVDLMNL